MVDTGREDRAEEYRLPLFTSYHVSSLSLSPTLSLLYEWRHIVFYPLGHPSEQR